MMICQRCHVSIASESEARRHFTKEHPEQAPAQLKPVRDLSVGLSGLTRGEAALVMVLVQILRIGGGGVDRLRAQLKLALVEAYEYEGDVAAARRIEASL